MDLANFFDATLANRPLQMPRLQRSTIYGRLNERGDVRVDVFSLSQSASHKQIGFDISM